MKRRSIGPCSFEDDTLGELAAALGSEHLSLISKRAAFWRTKQSVKKSVCSENITQAVFTLFCMNQQHGFDSPNRIYLAKPPFPPPPLSLWALRISLFLPVSGNSKVVRLQVWMKLGASKWLKIPALEDSSMRRGNATLRWRQIRNRTFPFCHL